MSEPAISARTIVAFAAGLSIGLWAAAYLVKQQEGSPRWDFAVRGQIPGDGPQVFKLDRVTGDVYVAATIAGTDGKILTVTWRKFDPSTDQSVARK